MIHEAKGWPSHRSYQDIKRWLVKPFASSSRPLFIDRNTTNLALGARFRKARSGPESDLVESFLRVMPLYIPRGCRATVFRELRLESGFPDLVIVVWREETTFGWRPERKCLQTQDFRLMHFLHHYRRAGEDNIVEWFGRRAFSSIERLYDAAMIRFVGSSWVPCALRQSFAAAKIIAVEAKVSKWTDVLNQAVLNTWFASKSCVLVPRLPTDHQVAAAQRHGIGVCSVCDGEVVEVASESTRLPRSYASWALNDWAWRSSHQSV